jgi:hypothetical protein
MRFHSEALRARSARPTRRFSITAFEIENRLESRSSAATLLTPLGGFMEAGALGDNQPGGFVISQSLANTDAINANISGSSSFTPDTGTGSGTSTDQATVDVGTATGANGGSNIDLSGVVSGSINASTQTGMLFGVGSGASVQSVAASGGGLAPMTWNVGNTIPGATTGSVTYTFSYSGTDGINPVTGTSMDGQFQLQILAPGIQITLNNPNQMGTNAGLNIFVNATPGNPMAWALAYSHGTAANPNPDGSIDGVVNYNPGVTDAQGGSSFSGAYSVTLPVAPPGTVLGITTQATFGEAATAGVPEDTQVLAIPSMQWSFNVTGI